MKSKYVFVMFVVLLFFSAHLTMRIRQLQVYAQSCMTVAQIQSDTRCLYRLNGLVYAKGTKSRPHQGVACGTDVTSTIPSFHFSDVAAYLDPNLVGSVCTQTPTATPRPTATTTPTPTPAKKSGDANGDNQVDGIDYAVWLAHYMQTNVQMGASYGDFTGDLKVDGQDYAVWLMNYRK